MPEREPPYYPRELEKERSEIERSFYILKNGKYVNSEYRNVAIHANDNCEIPTLIIAKSPDEIEKSKKPRYGLPNYEGYYDEYGMPHTTYEYKAGLENYYLFLKERKSIFAFDNHAHALFAWQEAKEAKILENKVALIRLDAHSDLEAVAAFDAQSRKNIKKAIVDNTLNIKNFTEPALRSGLISKMYFCSGLPEKNIVKLAERKTKEKIRISSEFEVIKKYAEEGKLEDISREVMKSPDYLTKLTKELKAGGYDIILDVDFDIFTRENTDDLFKNLPNFAQDADVITCATSPAYTNQDQAISKIKHFLENILK